MRLNNKNVVLIPIYIMCVFILGGFWLIKINWENEARDWQALKQEKSCQLISVDNRHAKYGWLCSDGITYFNKYAQ